MPMQQAAGTVGIPVDWRFPQPVKGRVRNISPLPRLELLPGQRIDLGELSSGQRPSRSH